MSAWNSSDIVLLLNKLVMATIEQFKQVRASVDKEVQTELYGLLVQDFDAAVERIISIGAGVNVNFTADEVTSFLIELDEEDEFDDVELDEATLAAVSGGNSFAMQSARRMKKRLDAGGGRLVLRKRNPKW